MDTILIAVLVALVSVVVGGAIGFQLHNLLSAKSQRAVEEASAQQMRRSNARSKEILLEAKEQASSYRQFYLKMEPRIGFEPTTYALRMRCSTTELSRHKPLR